GVRPDKGDRCAGRRSPSGSQSAAPGRQARRYPDRRDLCPVPGDKRQELATALSHGQSAVRAMDAVQAWASEQGKGEVKRFVVTGGSKRGWTTWLTGAVDNRVIAIAPMVIVMLNMGAQGPNQLDVWGQYSEQ